MTGLNPRFARYFSHDSYSPKAHFPRHGHAWLALGIANQQVLTAQRPPESRSE